MTDLIRGLSIFLVGMMGTGKTTVGQVLAKQLGYRFFDTDVLIERVTQQSISEIFTIQGEEAFRDIESQILMEVCACTKSVIATGGGIVLRPKNWSYLRHGLVIWLDVPTNVLVQRLLLDTTRPLLQETELKPKLETLMDSRKRLYSEADLHISIENAQTPEEIVAQILDRIPLIILPEKASYSVKIEEN
ncbi:shikimate kinase [Aphanothece hegewaldii CCALA 016]|uniref:Shikimate kinase n=1 Tax=Aphanothece hegewaldii CCALA 016 TaxID=2107694 RepID=A0A2T1LZ14_9CHRO|nr:shikimate kinase [Aphanothece hegewaldii]PSF37650.1 shikimate kinase [Aphanothece hegewaldii CCALA 016]